MWGVSTKKYLVCPGWVWSRTDGDQHYIGAADLMRLFGVSPAECVVRRHRMHDRPPYSDLIHLFPKDNGEYKLPKRGGE